MPSTFSQWLEVTFDNPTTARYVFRFGRVACNLRQVFSDTLAVAGHSLAGMPMYAPFLRTTNRLLTLLQSCHPVFNPDILIRESPVAASPSSTLSLPRTRQSISWHQNSNDLSRCSSPSPVNRLRVRVRVTATVRDGGCQPYLKQYLSVKLIHYLRCTNPHGRARLCHQGTTKLKFRSPNGVDREPTPSPLPSTRLKSLTLYAPLLTTNSMPPRISSTCEQLPNNELTANSVTCPKRHGYVCFTPHVSGPCSLSRLV